MNVVAMAGSGRPRNPDCWWYCVDPQLPQNAVELIELLVVLPMGKRGALDAREAKTAECARRKA